MADVVYYLNKLLPYIVLFPILSAILLFALFLLFKKGMNNNNVSLYGLFLDFSKKEVFSLALIFLGFIMVIETLFVTDFTPFCMVFVFTPALIYGIINLDLKSMIINVFGFGFLVVMCFFERVFLSYFLNVDDMWYVFILFLAVCIFIFVIDFYLLIRNLNSLSKNKIIKKKRVV